MGSLIRVDWALSRLAAAARCERGDKSRYFPAAAKEGASSRENRGGELEGRAGAQQDGSEWVLGETLGPTPSPVTPSPPPFTAALPAARPFSEMPAKAAVGNAR